jgi:hypothetical protein
MATRGKGIRSSAQDNFIAPDAPTGVSATDVGTGRAFNNGAATITFSAPTTGNTVGITSYTATSSPGGFTASGASSPLTVTGLQSNTSYTFTVTATNAYGTSAASSASASITATTVPATPSAPTVSSVSNQATDVVTWTAPATGGKAITGYTWTSSDGKSGSTASTSVNVAQEAGTAQTYNVYATNANGNSGTSANSTSFTSFSVFGFTPFSVFGFTPFNVFGFTPTPPFSVFGFTPFSSDYSWLDGGTALAPDLFVRTESTDNSITANFNDIKVGDNILSMDINTNEVFLTKVVDVLDIESDSGVLIDGDVFLPEFKILTKKDNKVEFTSVTEIDTTYQKYSYLQNDFVDIFIVEDIDAPLATKKIIVENKSFFAGSTLVSF